MEAGGIKKTISGVSPAFAMSKMDDEAYPEADAYTEDERSATLLNELIAQSKQNDLILRYQAIPYGAANVGRALGGMAYEKRFHRPTIVFLDGDQEPSIGCAILPGGDAPERVVFEGLIEKGLEGVAARLGRSPSDVSEACSAASLVSDHHDWVKFAADRLKVRGDVLWQCMCAEWSRKCATEQEGLSVGDAIMEAIVRYGGTAHTYMPSKPVQTDLSFTP
jgi:hypothetical protein